MKFSHLENHRASDTALSKSHLAKPNTMLEKSFLKSLVKTVQKSPKTP